MTTENNSSNSQLNKLTDWYNNNQRNANIVLIGLIVVVGLFLYYTKVYRPDREKEAAGQLFMAERYFGLDSMNQVLKGDGKYPSAIDVADEYGNTKAGNLAKYYAGRAYMSKNDFKNALEYLEDVKFTDEIMTAAIIGLQADCKSELGETAEAAEAYMKAASARENLQTSPMYLMKAGLHFEEVKDYENAAKAYRTLRDKFKESPQAQSSAKYLARVLTSMGQSPE
ncbi:MAG: tetratricopeptide repeat protein [Flavobacteriales bacterium]|nr:tetratricopeptide repeat protein [Flavobacteriales bacterium]